jgi:hypothetical protein
MWGCRGKRRRHTFDQSDHPPAARILQCPSDVLGGTVLLDEAHEVVGIGRELVAQVGPVGGCGERPGGRARRIGGTRLGLAQEPNTALSLAVMI